MVAAPNPIDLPLRDRLLIVAGVACAHVLLLWFYTSSSSQSKSAHREMSISMALPSQTQTAAVEPKPQVKPKSVKPEPVPQVAAPDTAAEMPVETSNPSPPVESAPSQPENIPPGLPDSEPDFQAAYLNNPLPGYPMVARRMGWQGKVVLNVEVLENGLPGQIKLHQSSGREVLDNAAIQAVRSWRFVAARQNGQIVAKWFLVPIPFILKESE